MRPKSCGKYVVGLLRLEVGIRYVGLRLGLGYHVMSLLDDNIGKTAKYPSGNELIHC